MTEILGTHTDESWTKVYTFYVLTEEGLANKFRNVFWTGQIKVLQVSLFEICQIKLLQVSLFEIYIYQSS